MHLNAYIPKVLPSVCKIEHILENCQASIMELAMVLSVLSDLAITYIGAVTPRGRPSSLLAIRVDSSVVERSTS